MKRKNIFVALLVVAFGFGISVKPAQSQEFSKGDKVLNLGLGLGTALYSGGGYKMSIPPISASFEVGVKDDLGPGNLGVGGYLGIAGSKYEYAGSGWKYTYVVIGARGSYHFKDIADKFDLYAGLMPYYSIVSSTAFGAYSGFWGNTSAKGSFFSISIFGGARYYFSDKFAAMAELGWGVSYLNLGVALKF